MLSRRTFLKGTLQLVVVGFLASNFKPAKAQKLPEKWNSRISKALKNGQVERAQNLKSQQVVRYNRWINN